MSALSDLPPITLPLNGDLSDLIDALGEATAAITAFSVVAEKILGEGGKKAGKDFSDNMKHEIERDDFATWLSRSMRKITGGVGGALSGTLGVLGRLFMPAMWTGLITGAGQALTALAPAVGALGLIPAAAMGAALGLGTLITAFHGLGDALKNSGDPAKYAEALKKLAPAAQEAVKAMVSLKPLLHSVRMEVQQDFFSQWAKDIKSVGGTYLPIMRRELGGIAGALGDTVHEIMQWLQVPDTVKSINRSLDNMRQAWINVSHAFLPFFSGFNDLLEVGSKFLPGLGAGIAGLGDRFSAFMAQVAGNGSLERFIQGGIDTLKLIGPLLADVWNILHPLIVALNASNTGGGLGFLGTLLHQLGDFFNSTQGVATLTAVFSILNTVFTTFGDVLVALLPPLGQLLIALAPVIIALVQALTPALLEAASALTTIIGWITPLIPYLAKLAPAVTILADIIMGLLVPAFILWAINATAAAIANIAATWEILLLIAAVAALGYGIYELIKHWSTVWKWIKGIAGDVADFFVMIWHWIEDTFNSVWGHIKDAAKAVGGFFARMWDDIVGAFTAAIDWIEALPGRVWGALQKLPGLALHAMEMFAYNIGHYLGEVVRFFVLLPSKIWHIIVNLWATGLRLWMGGIESVANFTRSLPDRIAAFWSALKARTVEAYNSIKDHVIGALKAMWDGIKWLFTDGISKAWSAIKTFGKNIWDWIKGIGPAAKGAAGDAGHWLYNAGRDMITGLINGAKSLFSSAWDTIKDFAKSLFHGFMDGIQGKSPSRLFMRGGESIVSGLVKGIVDNAGAASEAVAALIGFSGGRGLGAPSFAVGAAIGGGVGGIGGGGGGRQVVENHIHVYLDGKELHAGLIQPAQRYKRYTGTTGLT